jgi:hypothetical protein
VSTSQSEPPPPSAAHTVPISGAHNPDQRRLKVNTDRDHAASGQAYLAHLPSRAGVSDRPIQGPPENCAGSIPPWLAPATVPQCYVRFVSVMRLSVVGIAVAANRRPRARRCVTRPSPPVSRRRWSEQAIYRSDSACADRQSDVRGATTNKKSDGLSLSAIDKCSVTGRQRKTSLCARISRPKVGWLPLSSGLLHKVVRRPGLEASDLVAGRWRLNRPRVDRDVGLAPGRRAFIDVIADECLSAV